jgi:hypothetical protein
VCSLVLARRGWPVSALTTDIASRTRPVVASGLAAGLAGAALFIVIHSLLIFPIWTRFLGHLPFALVAGLALSAAFDRAAAADIRWGTIAGGGRVGFVIFLTLAPPTVFANLLRATGIGAGGWPGFLGTLALAIGSGAAAGFAITGRQTGVLAFAAATLGLTIAMGGAIPVVNSSRAAMLFAGFLPICVGSGLALSAARRCLTFPEHS